MHADAPYAAGTAVGNLGLVGCGRTSEYPRALLTRKLVNGVTNRIPNGGHALPLVDNVRTHTCERIAWIGNRYLKIGATVHVGDRRSVSKR